MEATTLAAIVGLTSGIVLGLAARLGEFCTFGAIESAYMGHDQKRLRLWGIVLGTAIIAVYGLNQIDQIDVGRTLYLQTQWNPLGSIFGGLLFGYGMSRAGNCGFGALTRFGGGDLRSMVVVIVIAITGFMTLNGPLADLRIWLFPMAPANGPQGIAQLAAASGIPPMVTAAVIGSAFILWALLYPGLRAKPGRIFWGVMAGLAIASAFWGTTTLYRSSLEEVAIQGHTFTAPLGRTMLYLMTSSGGGLGFSVGSVSGVLIGAFVGARIRGLFRWEACEDPRELGRQISGAAMMGIGGIVALGCSIGQGVSAFSTLAFSGPVTLAAIVAGSVLGLRHLLAGFAPD